MSEPISAFAAYRSGTAKGANAAKNKKNATAGAGANKRNVAINKSTPKDKPKAAPKKQAVAKENGVPKAKSALAKPKVTASKAGPTSKKQSTATKATATTAKAQPRKQQQNRQHAATNGKVEPNGFKEDKIDTLVEQLFGDSPSHPKKLTKAQQKQKKELEDYLLKQLESDDKELEPGSVSDSSEESSEFSDEYTINSYSNDEEGEEEETSCSCEECSSDSSEGEEPLATASKRKSTGSDATNAKKPREVEKASNKRKSMPEMKTAQPATEQQHSVSETDPQNASASKVMVKTVDARVVKMEPLSPPSNIVKMNSIVEAKKVFAWLLAPLPVKEFFTKYWELGACLIRRKGSNHYSHLISFEAIDQMLLKNHVEFTKNIDITTYKNGCRETLNPEGRALPPVVWDHYGQGCSIRLLNPQTFLPEVYLLNTTLQEYFHCLVGANAYLTPPNSQGFAPHYDDIEAFVLQIEGRKRWRLYKPRTQAEQLPRYSSDNFSQEEVGQPIFDEVLSPGDLLYFTRGTIHQACTEPGYHSLHITLSVYQKQSYADLFERIMPLLLQRAIERNIDMRCGLPLHTFQHAGIVHSNNGTQERAELLRKVTKLMVQCVQSVPLDDLMDTAVDQLAKKYQHEALPPYVLPTERVRTIFGSRSTTNEHGECTCDYKIDQRTNVRLLRANIMRLVQEDGKLRIYYYLDNSKEYCEYEPNFIEIEEDEAAAVEVLIRSYPEYVGVAQLPFTTDERKITLVTALWERGLLMTEKPFKERI